MEVVVIGIATAFNFIVILWKLQYSRVLDGLLDILVFIAIASMFSGTISGMSVGMVASMVVSIYLLKYSPELPSKILPDNFIEEFKSKL